MVKEDWIIEVPQMYWHFCCKLVPESPPLPPSCESFLFHVCILRIPVLAKIVPILCTLPNIEIF